MLKILREASLLAKISHPNIVSYKTAWIEPCSRGVSFPGFDDYRFFIKKSKVIIQGLVEVDGNTCSGSESFEEWEERAIIEEVRSDVFY